MKTMIHLKGKQIKKPWQVILRTNGTELCQVFGPYRFRWVANIVAASISLRIWLEDAVSYHQYRRAGVYEISESFSRDPIELERERLEDLHQEINGMLEQEGYKDPAV